MHKNYKNLFYSFFLLSLSGCGACVPNLKQLRTEYPHVIYHGPKVPSEIVIKKNPPEKWVSLNQISKKARGAVIVSEDSAFYSHPGYDEKEIKVAIKESLEEKRLTRGASTITQQVVKNIFLSKEKSLIRKVRELWIATKIETVLTKNKILELYFNIAEMGEGIYGIGKASSYYFHKSPDQLTAKEGAFLAMLLPSPKKYSISFRRGELTVYARRTIAAILRKMVISGYLTREERDQEWSTPLSFEKNAIQEVFPKLDEEDSSVDEELDIESVD